MHFKTQEHPTSKCHGHILGLNLTRNLCKVQNRSGHIFFIYETKTLAKKPDTFYNETDNLRQCCVCLCFRDDQVRMGSEKGDPEEPEQFTPFRPFTRESLFNIERRIAEEHAAKVKKTLPNLITKTNTNSLFFFFECHFNTVSQIF